MDSDEQKRCHTQQFLMLVALYTKLEQTSTMLHLSFKPDTFGLTNAVKIGTIFFGQKS